MSIIHDDTSKKNRDLLIEKKSQILSQTRSEIDSLYDIINSDEKNIKNLVSILEKSLIKN